MKYALLFMTSMSAIVAPIPSTAAEEEYNVRVTFAGISKHLEPISISGIEYNERHGSFGVNFHKRTDNNTRYRDFGFMYMRDSYKQPAISLGAAYGVNWSPFNDFNISAGLVGGLQARSYTKSENQELIKLKRTIIPFIAPELSASYKNVGTSLIVFPQVKRVRDKLEIQKPVLFLHFFYDF
ncbi:hypothetical protein AB4254_07975 [Vibrio breoganii]